MYKKLFKLYCKLLWNRIGILKCNIVIKSCHIFVWLIRKLIVVQNKTKYLYHKLTTYNTDKIWQICAKECNSWPGTYDYDNNKCTRCEMWNKFSSKLKAQLHDECMDYANHCMTGE